MKTRALHCRTAGGRGEKCDILQYREGRPVNVDPWFATHGLHDRVRGIHQRYPESLELVSSSFSDKLLSVFCRGCVPRNSDGKTILAWELLVILEHLPKVRAPSTRHLQVPGATLPAPSVTNQIPSQPSSTDKHPLPVPGDSIYQLPPRNHSVSRSQTSLTSQLEPNTASGNPLTDLMKTYQSELINSHHSESQAPATAVNSDRVSAYSRPVQQTGIKKGLQTEHRPIDSVMRRTVPSSSQLPEGIWDDLMDRYIATLDAECKDDCKEIIRKLKRRFPMLNEVRDHIRYGG